MQSEFIKIAIGQLDYLDPILGLDLENALEIGPNRIASTMEDVYKEALERANVHAPGTLRSAWDNVLDALSEAMK
jgi:hypothetical protein